MTTPSDTKKKLEDILSRLPPADWVLRMEADYHRTGTCRSEDLIRLLGDQTKGLHIGGAPPLAHLLNREAR